MPFWTPSLQKADNESQTDVAPLVRNSQDISFDLSELSDIRIDLLFFHRSLQCLIAFELKTDRFEPEYLGKTNFYLEALDRDVRKPHENPSIGILLCKDRDEEVVEYSLSRSLSPTMVAQYLTQMPEKKLLQQKLHELFQKED